MKYISLCILLLPGVLAADAVVCPATGYADILLLPSCTMSIPSSTSEFGVSRHDPAASGNGSVTAQDFATIAAEQSVSFAVSNTFLPAQNLAVLTAVAPDMNPEPVTVPEPWPCALIGAGLVGLGLMGRLPRLRL